MMSRRETLFRSVVTAQVIAMGSDMSTWKYSTIAQQRYFAIGDGSITPVLAWCDYSLQECFGPEGFDRSKGECYPPILSQDNVGSPLDFAKIILSDPSESAQLPYAGDYNIALYIYPSVLRSGMCF